MVYVDNKTEKIVTSIFNSLLKENTPDEVFMTIFLDSGVKELFELLPTNVKNNANFVKKALSKKAITYFELPKIFYTAEFLSKKQYMQMLEMGVMTLKDNIYEQDKEIALASLKHTGKNIKEIKKELKEDKDFIVTALLQGYDILNYLNAEVKQKIINDYDLFKSLIVQQPKCFLLLPEEEKKKSQYLSLMLNDIHDYRYVENVLKRNGDIDIALKALKLTNNSLKQINQRYYLLIKENNATSRPYEFLSLYATKQKLEKDLENKEPNAKMKI